LAKFPPQARVCKRMPLNLQCLKIELKTQPMVLRPHMQTALLHHSLFDVPYSIFIFIPFKDCPKFVNINDNNETEINDTIINFDYFLPIHPIYLFLTSKIPDNSLLLRFILNIY
jgi:hypothetical protein